MASSIQRDVEIEDCEVIGVTKTRSSLNLLQLKLDEHIVSLETKYPNARYPNGKYLEGVLLLCKQRFFLPSATIDEGGMTPDAKLFYQSKLRITVGDKVLLWTEEDVERAHNKRREQIECVVKEFLEK
ncbi:hypothetical protein GOP47_0006132, partial [Adiantum capillus-veneris]